jgi:transposase
VTERELARGAARRLAIIRHVQEVTGNVALTCRYYGITRQCYYIWFRRYEEFGAEGLWDRSSRPHVSPRTTREEVVGKIVYLRQNYHFGPHKIAMYLERYHEIKVSPSGIWRILKRLDMSRLPAGSQGSSPYPFHGPHDRMNLLCVGKITRYMRSCRRMPSICGRTTASNRSSSSNASIALNSSASRGARVRL